MLRIDRAIPQDLAGTEILIVGSPTRRFNSTAPVKQFLDDISPGSLDGISAAAFDTRFTEDEVSKTKVLDFFVNIFGYAAEPISKKLVKKGVALFCPPEGFYVAGMEGPLLDGELARAAGWAEEVCKTFNRTLR